MRKTAKERQSYHFEGDGTRQITNIRVDSFFYDQIVEDLGGGEMNIRMQFQNHKVTAIIGTFCVLICQKVHLKMQQ